MEPAKLAVLRLAQKETCEELLKYLTQNNAEKVPHNLRKTCAFLDEDVTIPFKGRLRLSGLSPQMKHPVLLSLKHPLVILMLRQAHEVNYIEGTDCVRSVLQQEFWIMGL